MKYSDYAIKTKEEVLKLLSSSEDGLAKDDREKRLLNDGPNEIKGGKVTGFKILARQFASPFIYLLIGAAGLSVLVGSTIDGILIIGFVIINTTLSFLQEYKSERTVEMLSKFTAPTAKVKIDGKDEKIVASQIVTGDIVILEAGDIVPADALIINTNDILVDESLLSGESIPVNKTADTLLIEPTDIHSASNILFSGTKIIRGYAEVVIIQTGANTMLGSIATTTKGAVKKSIFTESLSKLSNKMLKIIVVVLVFVYIISLFVNHGSRSPIELLLFSIALAVTVIPEALPLVTTISFAHGAKQLAKQKTIVKHLVAVEDLGGVDILCTDKTGTLTENKMKVANIFIENYSQEKNNEKILKFLGFTTEYAGSKGGEVDNAFDVAFFTGLPSYLQMRVRSVKRISEIPFDPIRKRNSTLVDDGGWKYISVCGAPEEVLELCLDKEKYRNDLEEKMKSEGLLGRRIVAVAYKQIKSGLNIYDVDDESELNYLGLISLEDPIKESSKEAIIKAEELGLKIKMLTGDAKEVATAVGRSIGILNDNEFAVTGAEINLLSGEELYKFVMKSTVFARVSPEDKFKIIEILESNGHSCAFLGDGINDAPALRTATVGMVVDTATDIAKDAADIVLLTKSLDVIVHGISYGRKILVNMEKYLRITLTANIGHLVSSSIATLALPFLPMLPKQLLLLNLLTDFPMIAIALDNVDTSEIKKPRSYNVNKILKLALIFGIVDLVFDLFVINFFKGDKTILYTYWFLTSVMLEIIFIYLVRTENPFSFKNKPDKSLVGLTFISLVIAFAMPALSITREFFGFSKFNPNYLIFILVTSIVYIFAVMFLKKGLRNKI